MPVSQVFSDEMWTELKALMVAQGWPGIDDVAARWEAEYAPRKIVSGFMKDKTLGDKRLASMPDRITNTINTRRGVRNRPTVINCFAGDMTTTAKWWANWKDFMFKEKLELGSADAPVRLRPPDRPPSHLPPVSPLTTLSASPIMWPLPIVHILLPPLPTLAQPCPPLEVRPQA